MDSFNMTKCQDATPETIESVSDKICLELLRGSLSEQHTPSIVRNVFSGIKNTTGQHYVAVWDGKNLQDSKYFLHLDGKLYEPSCDLLVFLTSKDNSVSVNHAFSPNLSGQEGFGVLGLDDNTFNVEAVVIVGEED